MVVLLVVHVAATLFLVGMIWTIQLVHYPLFASVGQEVFDDYEAAHSVRITAVIAIPWALEGLTTLALLVTSPPGVPSWLVWAGAALATVPVLVTLVFSVPAHAVLGGGFDPAAHRRLLATNWLRTLGWTGHGVVALGIAVLALRRG